MRPILWLAVLSALAFPHALFPQTDLEADLAVVESFFPRLEGSEGERKLVAFVESRLGSMGLQFTPFDFSQSDFEHSFSTCIRVEVRGRLRDTLIVVVPLNHDRTVARGQDGAVNVALALDLLRKVKEATPAVSLMVLFLGAEYGETDAYPMGSTLFLRDFQPDYRASAIYLNLQAIPSRLLIRGGGRGIVSPYWLVNRCVEILRAEKLPHLLRSDENQAFRMGLADQRTIIEPFLNAGYPSVGLEGEYGPVDPRTANAWLEATTRFFTGFLAASSQGIPQEWDRHYLLFQAGDSSLIIPERQYLSILLAVLAGALAYSLAFRKGLRKYLRTLKRNFWVVVPLAGLTLLFLVIATFAIQQFLVLRRFPGLWSYAPMEFLLLKLGIALFLYGALYNLLRRLPFPRNGSFYSAAALLFLLIDVFVIAAINISFSYYFLWAFLFEFLSARVPNRTGKLLLFLPAPYWLARGLIEAFTSPALPFCELVLVSPLLGNLLITGISLPFVLMIIRIGLLFPGVGITRRKVREVVVAGALLVGLVAIGWRLYRFSPFSPENPQPITVTQSVDGEDQTNVLEVASPAPLGRLVVRDGTGSRELYTDQTVLHVPLLPMPSPVKMTAESREFLNKMNVLVTITAAHSPRSVAVTLAADEDFVLYDCSFPFIRLNPREYRVLIGAFPPNPLPLELTFPMGMQFTLEMTMEVDAPLIGSAVSPGGDADLTTRLRLAKRLKLTT